jgi:hypothetical protein
MEQLDLFTYSNLNSDGFTEHLVSTSEIISVYKELLFQHNSSKNNFYSELSANDLVSGLLLYVRDRSR